MNKKILVSLAVIGVIAAIAVGGTIAYFSDTETSIGNIFTAGSLDLKVDNTCHYNGNECIDGVWTGNSPYPAPGTPCDCTWRLKDLDETNKFFNLLDVKPGDEGESTISLHVYNNDAWGCVTITPTANHDNGLTGPESKVDTTGGDWEGELAQNMQFMIWADVCDVSPAVPGDNIYQEGCDRLLTQGTGPLAPVTWALADSVTPNVFTGLDGPLIGSNDYYIGVSWNIPTTVGNIIQSDSYSADISFYTEQHRNNPNFVCNSGPGICSAKPDVMQVLDRSGSISSGELTILKNAAKAFVTALDPKADGAWMGQTSFATNGTLDLHLTSDVAAINAAIDGINREGYTNLYEGLLYANQELADANYDRPDATSPDFIVVITDGEPNRPEDGDPEALAEAQADAADSAGTIIYVIGVGVTPTNKAWLENEIATTPAHYFDADDFDDLQLILEGIADCD